MKAMISVTQDDGSVLEGVAELHPQREGRLPRATAPVFKVDLVPDSLPALDFETGPRPFMKKYGADLSRPERLILLVAYFAKGKIRLPIARADVVGQWGKMKPIMGGKYNGAYDTRARDTGWLHSPKPGVFELRPGWEQILK